jgi:hypothetical protein
MYLSALGDGSATFPTPGNNNKKKFKKNVS